jgi:hypothetical protein
VEPERAVLSVVDLRDFYWPPGRKAVLIPYVWGGFIGDVVPGARHTITGIAIGFKKQTVELIRATLCLQNDRGLPGKLGGGRVICDAELRDAFKARLPRNQTSIQLVG